MENAKVATRWLDQVGHEARWAASGAEALALLAQGAYDLLLLDIEMPRMDGYELAGHLRSDVRLREVGGHFQEVQEPPPVTVGRRRQEGAGLGRNAKRPGSEAPRHVGKRPVHQCLQIRCRQTLEYIDSGAGKERPVHFKRRIFSRRAN